MSTALVWFRRDLRSFDHSALYQALLTRLDSEGSWQDAMWLNTRAGSRYCQVRISRIVSEEDPDNHICVVTDTTESHQQEDRIRYLAHHDPVTGLTNRHSRTLQPLVRRGAGSR